MAEKIRPKLTRRLTFFMLIDGLGLTLFSVGIASLKSGGPVLFANFPTTTAEAVVSLLAGVAIMLYGVVQVMKEIGNQATPGKS